MNTTQRREAQAWGRALGLVLLIIVTVATLVAVGVYTTSVVTRPSAFLVVVGVASI